MKPFISHLLNLQGKVFRNTLLPIIIKKKNSLTIITPPFSTNEKRRLFVLDKNIKTSLPKIYFDIFISDVKHILIHSHDIKEFKEEPSIIGCVNSLYNSEYILHALTCAIQTLEEKEQALMRLYFAGFHYDEIARRTQTTMKEIRNSLPEILDELRVIINHSANKNPASNPKENT